MRPFSYCKLDLENLTLKILLRRVNLSYIKKLSHAIFLPRLRHFSFAVLLGAELEKFLTASWEIFCLWESFHYLPR